MDFNIPPHLSYVKPVTVECVEDVAKTHDVPIAAIITLMAQEAGQVGQFSTNTNGTVDYGPMQINTLWLKDLVDYKISQRDILWNGCLNVFVGTAIFKKHLLNSKGDIWKALGDYHSKTPKFHQKYVDQMQTRMEKRPKMIPIIERANRYLATLVPPKTAGDQPTPLNAPPGQNTN